MSMSSFGFCGCMIDGLWVEHFYKTKNNYHVSHINVKIPRIKRKIRRLIK